MVSTRRTRSCDGRPAAARGASAAIRSRRGLRPLADSAPSAVRSATCGSERNSRYSARTVAACCANAITGTFACVASNECNRAARAALSCASNLRARARSARTASPWTRSVSCHCPVSVRGVPKGSCSWTVSSATSQRRSAAAVGHSPCASAASSAWPRCSRRLNATTSAAMLDPRARSSPIATNARAVPPSRSGTAAGSSRISRSSAAVRGAANGGADTMAGNTPAPCLRRTMHCDRISGSSRISDPKNMAISSSSSARRFRTGVAESSRTARPAQHAATARRRAVPRVPTCCASSMITRSASTGGGDGRLMRSSDTTVTGTRASWALRVHASRTAAGASTIGRTNSRANARATNVFPIPGSSASRAPPYRRTAVPRRCTASR